MDAQGHTASNDRSARSGGPRRSVPTKLDHLAGSAATLPKVHVWRKSHSQQLTSLSPAVTRDQGLQEWAGEAVTTPNKPFQPCDFTSPRAQGSMPKRPQLALDTAWGEEKVAAKQRSEKGN